MIDVSPVHLETIKRILSEHVPTCEVRAFDSRVTWTVKDYSDLDLAIVGTKCLDADVMRRVKEAFAQNYKSFDEKMKDPDALLVTYFASLKRLDGAMKRSLKEVGQW